MGVIALNAGLAELVDALPTNIPAEKVLAFMARRHPAAVSRKELMTAGGFHGHWHGSLIAHVSFECCVIWLGFWLRSRRWHLVEPDYSIVSWHEIDDSVPAYRLQKI